MNRLRIGRGCQVAGVALIVLALVLLGYTGINPPRARPMAPRVVCANNLKQIGLSFRTFAIDNDGHFPFNLSTNAGGTRELCAIDSEGFDSHAALHFQVLSNELSTPKLLVCPKDPSRKSAVGFHNLQATNVSYRLHSGTNLNESNPIAVLVFCPFDGNTLHCDGSVTEGKAEWKPPRRTLMEVVRHEYLAWMSISCPAFMLTGVVLLWAGSRVAWKAKGGPKPRGLVLGEVLLLIALLLLIGLMLLAIASFV
jgi:hypothetical protein